MNGYQKLKEQYEEMKRSEQHQLTRATAYLIALLTYVPEEKREDAKLTVKGLMQGKMDKILIDTDPFIMMFSEE